MKREYKGEPLDGGYQHISESPYKHDGQTISATTEVGEINTEFAGESDTKLQKEILIESMKRPGATLRDIAEFVDCNWVYVSEVLLDNNVKRYKRTAYESLSDNAQQIVSLKASNPDATLKEISKFVGVSVCYVSKVVNANEHIIKNMRHNGGPNE